MPNHVHLIAVPDAEDSLSKALGQTHSEYALAFNRTEGRSGHLWQNRFFSCPLDRDHLEQALIYVELNPVRAGLVDEAWQWAWSSAGRRVPQGKSDRLVESGLWGESLDNTSLRCIGGVDSGLSEEDLEKIRRSTRVGEPLGSKKFLIELERRAGRGLRVRERGRPRKTSFEGGGVQEVMLAE
jgi:putative transposase